MLIFKHSFQENKLLTHIPTASTTTKYTTITEISAALLMGMVSLAGSPVLVLWVVSMLPAYETLSPCTATRSPTLPLGV